MTYYQNAIRNANDYKNVPPFPESYQAREIEVFFGDSPLDSVYHYCDGKWIGFNPENAGVEPVLQILVDDQWALIQAENEVLLDRMGTVELPTVPKQEDIVLRIAKMLGMEVTSNV